MSVEYSIATGGVEKEKEKEEQKGRIFFTRYMNFLMDAGEFDVTSSLCNYADCADDVGTSSSSSISSGSFHHVNVANTSSTSCSSCSLHHVNVADSISSTTSSEELRPRTAQYSITLRVQYGQHIQFNSIQLQQENHSQGASLIQAGTCHSRGE